MDDRIFRFDADRDTSGSLLKWPALRRYIEERGGAFHTFDWYRARRRRFDVALTEDTSAVIAAILLALRVRPRKVVLTLIEPPVVRPLAWKYRRLLAWMVGRVITCDPAVAARSRRFTRVPLPQPFDPADEERWHPLRERARSGFATMVRSNKLSRQPGELYTLRRDLIRFFEAEHPDLFDLFGFDWNDDDAVHPFFSSLYQGVASGQIDAFADYRFAISLDNSRARGLVTYDIFSAMLVGTVPVYLGAPDITDFIPGDCFIDMAAYPDFESLTRRMLEVADSGEWERYRERAQEFLASDAARQFSVDAYCETMYGILSSVAGSRSEATHESARLGGAGGG